MRSILAGDKVSAQAFRSFGLRDQRLWIQPPGGDADRTACRDLSAERGVERHAAALRKTGEDHALRLDLILS